MPLHSLACRGPQSGGHHLQTHWPPLWRAFPGGQVQGQQYSRPGLALILTVVEVGAVLPTLRADGLDGTHSPASTSPVLVRLPRPGLRRPDEECLQGGGRSSHRVCGSARLGCLSWVTQVLAGRWFSCLRWGPGRLRLLSVL